MLCHRAWVSGNERAQLTILLQSTKLFMIIKNIVDDRAKTGRREDDALQFLIDQDDSLLDMITVSNLSQSF